MDEIKCPVCGGTAKLFQTFAQWLCACGVAGPHDDPVGSKFRRLVYLDPDKLARGMRPINPSDGKVRVSAEFINALFAHWKTINDGALEIAAAHGVEIVP